MSKTTTPGEVASSDQLGLVFDAWWREQNTGLGEAHRFAAWNAWLEATKRAQAAERERLLGELRALLNDRPNATALTALAALTPSAPLSQADIEWADRFARGEA